MTLLLFVVGAAAAAAGTRLAAAAFVGAAIFGALDPTLAPIAVWTAAIGVGVLLVRRDPPVELALPALGACAVLAAGAAANGAVVLGLWMVGTAAACLSRGGRPAGRRWALLLCSTDLLLVVAIALTVPRGFEGWPQTLWGTGEILILAAAGLRVPLAAGPDDEGHRYGQTAGLLVVRTQTVVLIGFATASAGGGVLRAAIVVASVIFAAAPLARRQAVVDVAQELALVGVAFFTAQLGWGPSRWAWGALAAGALIHHLRFISGTGTTGAFAGALARSAGIGLPFLPVVVAQLEGAVRLRGPVGAAVVLGLAAGLVGRSRRPAPAVRKQAALDRTTASVVVAAVAAAAFWAPLMSLPRPPGGEAVGWPPAWAVALVVLATAAASMMGSLVAPARRQALSRPPWHALSARGVLIDRFARERVVWAALGLLAASALAVWIVGLQRGFL